LWQTDKKPTRICGLVALAAEVRDWQSNPTKKKAEPSAKMIAIWAFQAQMPFDGRMGIQRLLQLSIKILRWD
jgi:hypothetical protein